MLYSFVNHSFVPATEASLGVSDLALQRGYGIFDFCKVLNGRPIFLDDHLDRFYNSASYMRLAIPQDREGLKAILSELLQRNGAPDAGIKILLTGGYAEDGYSMTAPNLVITQYELKMPAEAAFQKGLRLISHVHQRQLPEIKTIDYLVAVWMQPVIKEQGVDDILYHRHGLLSECPRANFFIVTQDDTVVTAGRNVLKGVIRKKTLELARAIYPVEERDVTLEEALQAKEAFITSTTKHVMPVLQLDGLVIGNGQPGKITTALSRALNTYVKEQSL
ncbi:aminotransferase class IV [Chitinophaga agrisoli]|uniref:aminotransferase class IV n=1 Tax=Chitinophaga agrisoli TaxID=2607653 RepID=UPI001661D802|nr:aminotransferase class IV [Chitinophaga agrisoli]